MYPDFPGVEFKGVMPFEVEVADHFPVLFLISLPGLKLGILQAYCEKIVAPRPFGCQTIAGSPVFRGSGFICENIGTRQVFEKILAVVWLEIADGQAFGM